MSFAPVLIVITDLGAVRTLVGAAGGPRAGATAGASGAEGEPPVTPGGLDELRRSATTMVRRIDRVLRLARPGSVLVQLREKTLDAKYRLEIGRELRSCAELAGQFFSVNDRLDLAFTLGAAGVHLGEDGVDTADARLLLPGAWISRACHDPERVATLDADGILLSPILAPRKGSAALGLAALSRARALLDTRGALLGHRARPRLYALGGIDETNAGACLDAGADGVAVIGAVLGGREPSPLLGALGILRSS